MDTHSARLWSIKNHPVRTEVSPLTTIDVGKIAVFIGPFIPDVNVVFVQISVIGTSRDKPKQFVDDALPIDLLSRKKRKTLGKIKAHLTPKDRTGAYARPIHAIYTILFHVTQ